jgi:hypothetical protein
MPKVGADGDEIRRRRRSGRPAVRSAVSGANKLFRAAVNSRERGPNDLLDDSGTPSKVHRSTVQRAIAQKTRIGRFCLFGPTPDGRLSPVHCPVEVAAQSFFCPCHQHEDPAMNLPLQMGAIARKTNPSFKLPKIGLGVLLPAAVTQRCQQGYTLCTTGCSGSDYACCDAGTEHCATNCGCQHN